MSAESRQCPNCQGIFLPPAVPDTNPVQCPHCAGMVILGQCPVVVPDWQPVQEAVDRDERAEARKQTRERHSGWLRMGGVVAAVLALAAGGIFWWQHRGGGGAGKPGAPKMSSQEEERERKEETAAAMLAVRGVLEAPKVEDMLAWVRDRPRVEPMIRWMALRFPDQVQPVKVTGPDKVEPGVAPGGQWLRLRIETPGNPAQWVWTVNTPDGWRMDWEDYAHPERTRLAWLLKQAPGAELECRLMAVRAPVTDPVYQENGYSPQTDRAIFISARTGGEKALAFVKADGPLWQQLDGIDWNTGVMFVGKLRRLTLANDPALVDLVEVRQRGWGTPTASSTGEK